MTENGSSSRCPKCGYSGFTDYMPEKIDGKYYYICVCGYKEEVKVVHITLK